MVDERFKRLFALMFSNQPGERHNACDALVAHTHKLKLHPLDVFNQTGSGREQELEARLRKLQQEYENLKERFSPLADTTQSAKLKQDISALNARLQIALADNTQLQYDNKYLQEHKNALTAALDLASRKLEYPSVKKAVEKAERKQFRLDYNIDIHYSSVGIIFRLLYAAFLIWISVLFFPFSIVLSPWFFWVIKRVTIIPFIKWINAGNEYQLQFRPPSAPRQ